MRFDFSEAWATVHRLANGFAATLPRLVLAVVIVGLFFVVARVVRAIVRRNATRVGGHRTRTSSPAS